MAKEKFKKIKGNEVDAEQFDASAPEQQWPERVQINAQSSTGFSYGTLEPVIDSGNQTVGKDGFEIADTDWIVDDDNIITKAYNSDFLDNYELKG